MYPLDEKSYRNKNSMGSLGEKKLLRNYPRC
jgi:hypothetical protein